MVSDGHRLGPVRHDCEYLAFAVELAIMERDQPLRMLKDDEVDVLAKEIEAEKAAADAAKRRGGAGSSAP